MRNIIKMMPYNSCSQILAISLKTEKSFIAHPWCLLSVVGLEEYSAYDWRAAASVQSAPVTWRDWGLWLHVPSKIILVEWKLTTVCRPGAWLATPWRNSGPPIVWWCGHPLPLSNIAMVRSSCNPRSRCAWLTGPELRWGYARTSFGINTAAEVTISKCNLWKSWTLDLP